MAELNLTRSSNVYSIPGSSFKIQLVKEEARGLVKIFRGNLLSKEIVLPLSEFKTNSIVSAIQAELFMPISAYKILKVVEQQLLELKEETPSEQKSIESKFIQLDRKPATIITPRLTKCKDYSIKTKSFKGKPTLLSVLLKTENEKETADIFYVKKEDGFTCVTPEKIKIEEDLVKMSSKKRVGCK